MVFQEAVQNPSSPFWIYLLVVNAAAYAAMGADKYSAAHRKRRIPERTLFLLALLGGSAGGILGMYGFRHKTLHRKFTLGFPMILLAESALLLWLYFR